MTAKRALVVDDSRSARAFLARLLERHRLEVDGAESAEAALEYLQRSRPDVIFMDHQMPGMDGLQAVHLIKRDPRTAMIPILMYTSQEGELYLSQARALGALGVLPKQTRPADVAKALLQLHLLESSEDANGLRATPVNSDMAPAAMPPQIRDVVDAMLRDSSDEMRHFVQESLEAHSSRVETQMRDLLEHTTANLAIPQRLTRGSRIFSAVLLALSLTGLFAAGALVWQWYQAAQQQTALGARLQTLETQLAEANNRLETARADLVANSAAIASAQSRVSTPLLVEPIPFPEAPLAGNRVDLVRTELEKLLTANFRGRVDMRVYPGRFCLKSAPGENMVAAESDTLYSDCQVMNESQVAALLAQRESVTFANMMTSARKRAGATVQWQVGTASASQSVTTYPTVTDSLTAGEWNRAAADNYRLELSITPEAP
jgi:CheY-like chemotaxis protein